MPLRTIVLREYDSFGKERVHPGARICEGSTLRETCPNNRLERVVVRTKPNRHPFGIFMRHPFLIGKFLPAYGRSFGRLPKTPLTDGAIPKETLEARFAERGSSYRARRNEYLTTGQAGVVLSIGLMLVAFRLDFTADAVTFDNAPDQEVVQMEEILQTQQVPKPPPPPRPPVPVEVPDDIDLDEEELDLDAFLDMDAPSDLPPPLPPGPAEVEEDENEIFTVVEQAPEIIGGLQKLYELVEYPALARKSGLEGTVVVQIVVNADGTPSDPTIARGVHKVLDDAAIEGVMQLRFEPAMQRSRPVRVYMTLPVRFRLN